MNNAWIVGLKREDEIEQYPFNTKAQASMFMAECTKIGHEVFVIRTGKAVAPSEMKIFVRRAVIFPALYVAAFIVLLFVYSMSLHFMTGSYMSYETSFKLGSFFGSILDVYLFWIIMPLYLFKGAKRLIASVGGQRQLEHQSYTTR